MEEIKNTTNLIDRKKSYINHVAHIQNIPNPEQTQYMNYSHSVGVLIKKKNVIHILYK